MPTPAPCLLVLLRQVDSRWPGRGKASDGIMGDGRHQSRRSDHNSGNAIDITNSPGILDSSALAEEFRRQMWHFPAGRLSYIISRNLITSSKNGWTWVKYSGPNPHTSHAHFSIKLTSRNEMRPWKLP
jgi:hypothetical protein